MNVRIKYLIKFVTSVVITTLILVSNILILLNRIEFYLYEITAILTILFGIISIYFVIKIFFPNSWFKTTKKKDSAE